MSLDSRRGMRNLNQSFLSTGLKQDLRVMIYSRTTSDSMILASIFRLPWFHRSGYASRKTKLNIKNCCTLFHMVHIGLTSLPFSAHGRRKDSEPRVPQVQHLPKAQRDNPLSGYRISASSCRMLKRRIKVIHRSAFYHPRIEILMCRGSRGSHPGIDQLAVHGPFNRDSSRKTRILVLPRSAGIV